VVSLYEFVFKTQLSAPALHVDVFFMSISLVTLHWWMWLRNETAVCNTRPRLHNSKLEDDNWDGLAKELTSANAK